MSHPPFLSHSITLSSIVYMCCQESTLDVVTDHNYSFVPESWRGMTLPSTTLISMRAWGGWCWTQRRGRKTRTSLSPHTAATLRCVEFSMIVYLIMLEERPTSTCILVQYVHVLYLCICTCTCMAVLISPSCLVLASLCLFCLRVCIYVFVYTALIFNGYVWQSTGTTLRSDLRA